MSGAAPQGPLAQSALMLAAADSLVADAKRAGIGLGLNERSAAMTVLTLAFCRGAARALGPDATEPHLLSLISMVQRQIDEGIRLYHYEEFPPR